jgi:FtsZ-binding cell division protein ZapB
LDTLERLETKISLVLDKVKELEDKNRALEKELKTCRLEMQRVKEENIELKNGFKDKEILVKDKISALLGKLEEVEAEIA